MAVQLASNITPKNGQTYYMMEDIYLKGGLQIRLSSYDRDAIPPANLKLGALVLTLDDGKLWIVSSLVQITPTTPDVVEEVVWSEFQLGILDAPEDSQTYGRKNGEWVPVQSGSSTGISRKVAIHVVDELPPSAMNEFSLELAASSIILKLEVDRPCRVKAFGSVNRNESNPYEFRATTDHLIDDGTMLLADGTKFRSRNFSIWSNMDANPSDRIYLSVESVDDTEGPLVLTITYLPLEVLKISTPVSA